MTHDLVERLRDYGLTLEESVVICDRRVVDEAADRIEKLERENATLRAEKDEMRKALERIAAMWGTAGSEKGLPCLITDLNGTRESHTSTGVFASDVARQALAAIRNMGERT